MTMPTAASSLSPSPLLPSAVPEVLNGRYRIVRVLGQGGMGAVFLALDLASNERPVALKRVRKDKLDKRTLATLKNEFQALASLSHPNLIGAFEFGVEHDSGDLYFTSEYVDGITWLKATQRASLSTRKGLESFLDLTAQVLRGLEFIHRRGLVHSDIKPENILVTSQPAGNSSPDSQLQAKIIDFGLAKPEHASGGKKILGTPYYIAPETILGAPIDRRTDLYSLGVVLYHLATGSPPFRGTSNIEILKSHVERMPMAPDEAASTVPRALGEIILKLMAKNPQDRFQGALEVIDQMNHALGLTLPLETVNTCQSYLEFSRLAGREPVCTRLREILAIATSAKPASRVMIQACDEDVDEPEPQKTLDHSGKAPVGRLVVLRGEKGLQKRRCLEDFMGTAQVQGAKCFSLECAVAGHEAVRFERLLIDIASMGELRGKVKSLSFVDKSLCLVQRLQDFRDEPVAGYEPILDETIEAILKSSQEIPIVLFIHDLHLAAQPVLRLVNGLVKSSVDRSIARSKLLMVATVTDRVEQQLGESHQFLSTPLYRHNVLELQMQRLGENEVKQLIEQAFSRIEMSGECIHRVVEESDGNTEVVVEILRYLLEKGKIFRSVCGWKCADDLAKSDMPGQVRRELKDRIARLPDGALSLGRAFACLGDQCELDLAVQLCGIQSTAVEKSLEVLKAERIVQQEESGNLSSVYSFLHSSARAILYSTIPAADLPAYHQRAGLLCEMRGKELGVSKPRILAQHFLRAGARDKSLQYGLDAARELADEVAPLQAIELYEKVLTIAGDADPSLRFSIEREIAALRFQIGEYSAVVNLLKVSGILPEVKRSEKVLRCLLAARAQIRLGQYEKATILLNRSVRGENGQESTAELAAIMLALAELHFAKGNFGESLRCVNRLLKSKCELTDQALVYQVHMLLAENSASLNNVDEAESHCAVALKAVESQQDSRRLALSLFCRGKLHLFRREFKKALRQFQLCLLLRRKSSEVDGQADCLKEIGALLHLTGNQAEARRHLEEALTLYARTGNLAQAVSARCTLAEVCRLLGDYDACHEVIETVLRYIEPLEKRRPTFQTLLTMAGAAIDKGELQNGQRHLEEAERLSAAGRGSNVAVLRLFPLHCELAFCRGDIATALARAAEGVAAAREMKDPLELARMHVQQGYIFCRVGQVDEARKSLTSLYEAARHHDLSILDGWIQFIEGMVLADEGKCDQAEKAFQGATEIFVGSGSSRDLAYFYLEHGLLALKRKQNEQAYLCFEEGLHLTEKLQLSYLRSRYFYATAALESVIPGGQSGRAERNLLFAESVAAQTPYPEILWQIRYQLGKLFLAKKRFQEAEVRLRHAVAGVNAMLKTLSPAQAQAYRRVTGARDIESMIEGCRMAGMPVAALMALK